MGSKPLRAAAVVLCLASACLGTIGPDGPDGVTAPPTPPPVASGSGGGAAGGGLGGGGQNPTSPPACVGEATGWLPKGTAQLQSLCSRGYGDPISQAFCAATTPGINGLDDVLSTLGFKFSPGPYAQGTTSGVNGSPAFILTAQSTSITTRKVSQLNPRAILFTPPLSRGRLTGTPKPNASYIAMGFTRGDEAVELVAKDPTMNGELRFFLLKYELACDAQPGGCTPGDVYTAAAEKNFVSWSLYDDQDLKDTTLDCLQCHQPGGPSTPRMLRMQELQRPWQHWMYNDATGISLLRADFHAAHGTTESYGGIPAAALDFGDVQQLEAFVENNGYLTQPNEYQGKTILAELTASGTSATWQAQYLGSQNGQYIPVPYFDVRATDPVKVQALAQQYSAVLAGTLPESQLGDMSDVFSDATQRAMTHKPALGLDGHQLLVQVCQQCHNSNLDQSLSRAAFNIETLGALPRFEKDEAIRRINLANDDCAHMPPNRFRELDAAEIALVQTELLK